MLMNKTVKNIKKILFIKIDFKIRNQICKLVL